MHASLAAMKAFVDSGQTRPVAFRKQQLSRLKAALHRHEDALLEALHRDLRKPAVEAYATELGQVHQEITHTLRHLDAWARPDRRSTPLAFFPSRSVVYKEPLGVVLVIAPWNYPLMLLLHPLVGAIAAGNSVLCKPSEFAPATAVLIEQILGELFPPEYVGVLQGDGRLVLPPLLAQGRPDHIFFTGSIPVGREILSMAAPPLIPVTLELGGKSPCIVGPTVDLLPAARRIVQGKFINAGQTCVAPDYLLVHRSIKAAFLDAVLSQLRAFFGEDPRSSPDYARIVHAGRFAKLTGYLPQGRILHGGDHDVADLYIGPTLLDDVSPDSPLMEEEIFGPLLPIFTYDTTEEALAFIRARPWPLALYVFSSDRSFADFFLREVPFGGGCVNNTLVHFGNPSLPVGGIAYSGMGRYHGFESFRIFSHFKSVTRSGTWLDLRLKYPPYAGKLRLFKWFFR
ncbi:aldehyde dehydrogenase [Dinghuibacter silviterrae]|uniref:Aldehyde dehydrogenase n=1 Tax=Dinghuibacter silviterrae TaxID=1539049 RepID=A0A4R8DQ11_9BACT|nr:aldehyde dehydrogenase [Dinghuibacter silviterrae]TDW99978.1 aldehyde dehydrogenase (NAD+) [Dinghuibacter silviterrae]